MRHRYDLFVTKHPTAGRGAGLATAEEAASWRFYATLTARLADVKAGADQLVTDGHFENVRVFTGGGTIGREKFTARR